jgi:hypothetical protein
MIHKNRLINKNYTTLNIVCLLLVIMENTSVNFYLHAAQSCIEIKTKYTHTHVVSHIAYFIPCKIHFVIMFFPKFSVYEYNGKPNLTKLFEFCISPNLHINNSSSIYLNRVNVSQSQQILQLFMCGVLDF